MAFNLNGSQFQMHQSSGVVNAEKNTTAVSEYRVEHLQLSVYHKDTDGI